MKLKNKICLFFLCYGAFVFSAFAENEVKTDKPKNIIFMIGDGMGPNYLAAYRYFKHGYGLNARTASTLFDDLWVGIATTYPHDDTVITDSAAAATALSSGMKTYNGAIGVGGDFQSLPTLFELAKRSGKMTGLVVSSPITHATPASFYAHQKKRDPQEPIADDFIDNKIDTQFLVDVAFGGGTDFFIRKDRNIVQELQAQGFSYIDDLNQLAQLKKAPAIGLFGAYGLDSAIDSEEPVLANMTKTAIRLLSKSKQGFVLMVEGSQIDWCGHANDIACAMAELQDFEDALSTVLEYAKKDKNTLVVITADHETGGLSIGAGEGTRWLDDVVKQMHASAIRIAKNIKKTDGSQEQIKKVWAAHSDFNLRRMEFEAIKNAYSHDEEAIAWIIKGIVNTRSNTGWTSLKHTALDVPVMAFGPGSDQFRGVMDNTYIGQSLHRLLSSE